MKVNVRKLVKGVLMVCLLLASATTFSQTKTITGKVTDDKGAPLSASVVVKGGKAGTQTGADGSFSITVPASASTLVISSVGYEAQNASISSGNTVTVSLKLTNDQLSDIVVIGYGGVRKTDVTGAVSQVTSKDFNQGFISSPDQLVQGKVAGVEITNNSGQPGGTTTVQIRGNSSIRSGAGQPLYVIDGVPLDGRIARPILANSASNFGDEPSVDPLLFLNPNDIASVEVLKDASATAIYGSRGAYGVILITTKKGHPGQASVDANYSVGVSSLMHEYGVMDASDYRAAIKTYGSGVDGGANTDAQSAIVRTGTSQKADVAIAGGGENNNYRLALNYFDNEGILLKSDLKKYIARFNGEIKLLPSKKIKLEYNLLAGHTTENIAPVSTDAGYTGSMVGAALAWNPTQSLYSDSGANGFYQPGVGSVLNPVALSAGVSDIADISTVLASISPSVKLGKNFEYKFLYSINYQEGQRRFSEQSWLDITGVNGLGAADYATSQLSSQLITNTLSFTKQISSALNLNALAGYEYQDFVYKTTNMYGEGFSSNLVDYTNILQNATTTVLNSYADPTSSLQSYFARAILNYENRYLLTGTYRIDGSSKFGANNKYGYFPSFAAKWNISNEKFMKDNTLFNTLALRGGWGITGSQEFPSGAAQGQYSFEQGALHLSNVANPNLQWEQAKQTDIGLDFSILKNRVSGTLDYFNKNTTNLLFNTAVPLPGPATTYWVNLPCNVYNKGFEFAINGDIIKTKAVTWNLGVNMTFVSNDLENYHGPQILTGAITGQGLSGVESQTIANGQPLNVFYLPIFTGINQSGANAGTANYANNGANGFAGSPNAKEYLGIKTSVTYQKFTLTANLHGAFGYVIYNNTANALLSLASFSGGNNIDKSYILPGETTANPLQQSSRWLESGNYVKLSNVTVSYNLGNLANDVIKNSRIFFTATNVVTFTKYTGFDPEVNTDKSTNGVSSQGIEYTPYPTARTFILGVNFSL